MEMLIILALAFGAMWLMTSRTRKQQREAADFRANLEVGQEVMTGSGLFGTIVDVDGDTITLESTPGNQSRWIRAAIAKLVPPAEPVEGEDALDDEDAYDDDAYEDADAYDDADARLDADGTRSTGATATTAAYGTAPGVDRVDIPDDLSTMDERRDDGTNPR